MSAGERPTVKAVLAGEARYDDLPAREQATVREEWTLRINKRITSLDLAAEFVAEGRPWVEADSYGHAVQRQANQ
ncbi:hypothetical protein GCM10009821_29570 [Aeromicrobium halocynthiae]|uniref:Uncharacterized protein n=1 Tax=Aeromicrobium halocynthiae TaxID=560557 RepID=A0ABN2W8L2_9ACTN